MMNCFKSKSSKNLSTTKPSIIPQAPETQNKGILQQPRNIKHEVLLYIPGSKVHLVDEGEALELACGDFSLVRISDDDVCLATTVRVGEDLQWPLTKDEPVVKLDALHYLFSLPVKDGDPLSYGVTFSEDKSGSLGLLDSFLGEHSCFSCSSTSSTKTGRKDIDWKEFAPRVRDYNNFLARAIAGGTGQIVKGIFKCSNAYTNQVQKGGEAILIGAVEEKNGVESKKCGNSHRSESTRQSKVNTSLKRARKLSKMTERMSKAMLDGVGIVTGSVMGPAVKSQAGKSFFATVPGEILLASLDAVNKVLDAAEAAEKQALTATTGAATRIVTQRLGESAGEATGDVLATAGHCACTAWNILKIRKAINPASSVSPGGILKNAAKSSRV